MQLEYYVTSLVKMAKELDDVMETGLQHIHIPTTRDSQLTNFIDTNVERIVLELEMKYQKALLRILIFKTS